MPLLLRLAAFFFLLMLSAPVFAQSAEVPCGMEVTATGEKVEARNGDICPEDLAFQSMYLLWADVFSDPFFNIIARFFTSEATLNNEFTKFADQQMGLSQITYPLLSAVAILCWMLAGPMLIFKIYQYVAMIKRTGSIQFGESKGDTVKFVAYFLFLISLMLPVNTIMLGQGLAIVMSLPSIMGGNYIFSSYISSFRDAVADINIDDENLLMSSQVTANNFIEGELCQDRTRKALFTLNGAAFKEFYNLSGDDPDQEDIVNVYSSCLAYYTVAQKGNIDKSLQEISLSKMPITPSANNCWAVSGSFLSSREAVYKKEQHGYGHMCSQVTYNTGTNMYGGLLAEDHSELNDDMDDVSQSVMDTYQAREFYLRHTELYSERIKNLTTNETMSEREKFEEITAIIKLASKQMADRLTSNQALSLGRIDEIQYMHLAAGAALLGGTLNSAGGAGQMYPGSHSSPFDEQFGVDYLITEAREVAQLMQQYHCAMNWDKYSDIRLEIVKFNTSTDVKKSFDKGMPSMECVTVLRPEERGSSDTNRYWRFAVSDPRANDDIAKMGDVWMKSQSDTTATQEHMSTVVAKDLHQKVRQKQLLLATYVASVQKGVADNLVEKLELSINARSSSDYDLRSRGFSVFGGALLYLNKVSNSSSHMDNSIQEILQVKTAGEPGSYIHLSAFPPAKIDELQSRIMTGYSELQTDALFSIGYAGMISHPGPQGVTESQSDEASLANFTRLLESWTMGPLRHIKEAGGLPANKRLSEGLRECFHDGYSSCVSGHKHPMTALMRFGDEMMNNMLNIMLIRGVVKVINRTVSGMGDGMGSVKDAGGAAGAAESYSSYRKKAKAFLVDAFNKTLSFLKGAVSRMLIVVSVITVPAEVLLDVLNPFVIALFVFGAMFAYILPLTAYLYGFMLTALWLLGMAVVAFVLPFYALSKLFNIEKSYQRGFQEFYEGFLGPYLRPLFYGIAAVLAFSFMYIVVFIANTIFGLVYDGMSTASTGFSISSFMFDLFLYMMYFVTLFIMFRYALGIMKSFPDMLMSKLRLQKSNDEKFIDSLGFETYVNARVMQELAQSANAGVDKMSGGSLDQWKSKKQMKEFNDMVDEAGGPEEFAKALSFLQQQNAAKNSTNNDTPPDDKEGDPNAPTKTEGDAALPWLPDTESSGAKKTAAGSSSSVATDITSMMKEEEDDDKEGGTKGKGSDNNKKTD